MNDTCVQVHQRHTRTPSNSFGIDKLNLVSNGETSHPRTDEEQEEIGKLVVDRIDGTEVVTTKKYRTVFTLLEHNFSNVIEEKKQLLSTNCDNNNGCCQDDDGNNSNILTKAFLDACGCLTSLLELLGARTFAPVQMDMNGNIRKVRVKYEADTEKFAFLHSIILHEIETESTRARNSATDALLWLKRAVEFNHEFFKLFLKGDPDLTNCSSQAYSIALRPYHGWIARGMFAVANKAVPRRNDFIRVLCKGVDSGDTGDDASPQLLPEPSSEEWTQLEQQVLSDCASYILPMNQILKVINALYSENQLDSSEVV